MSTKIREVAVETVPKYRLKARNIVVSSLLPSEVKQRLLREIYNFFFSIETVVDYVASVVEEIEKNHGEYEAYFTSYIEVGKEFEVCENLVGESEELLDILYDVAHRVDEIALEMYSEIFEKLGYKVASIPWELKPIVRK